MSTEIDVDVTDALAKAMREWHSDDNQEDRSVAIFTAAGLLRAALPYVDAARQPAPALTAAELVRSTYPPSATAQRARELADMDSESNMGGWMEQVRDFLREIAGEKP